MKDIVIVSSRTTNNCSVPVIFEVVTKSFGGEEDTRELSRSYVFSSFEAQMPLAMAQKLVRAQPDEFFITGSVGKPSKEMQLLIEKEKERMKGFDCPHCKHNSKNKSGYMAHIRAKHPKEWAKLKETKV